MISKGMRDQIHSCSDIDRQTNGHNRSIILRSARVCRQPEVADGSRKGQVLRTLLFSTPSHRADYDSVSSYQPSSPSELSVAIHTQPSLHHALSPQSRALGASPYSGSINPTLRSSITLTYSPDVSRSCEDVTRPLLPRVILHSYVLYATWSPVEITLTQKGSSYPRCGARQCMYRRHSGRFTEPLNLRTLFHELCVYHSSVV